MKRCFSIFHLNIVLFKLSWTAFYVAFKKTVIKNM